MIATSGEKRLSSPPPLLELRNLCRYFGGLKAVDGLDLAVFEDEILGLVGPNGAGKTTVFNTICGVLAPTGGSIRFGGRSIGGLAPHTIARLGIGRTFQTSRPFKSLTCQENVLVALGHRVYSNPLACLRHYRTRTTIEEAEGLLEMVGLAGYKGTQARHLSLGLQRHLEVARALAVAPALLMLDEPGAGLTFDEARTLVSLVRRVRDSGTTVMLIEHNMSVVMDLCDRLVVLSYGRKIADGPPLAVREEIAVIEAYLGR